MRHSESGGRSGEETASRPSPAAPSDDRLVRELHRQAERARRGKPSNVWQGVGIIGSIGWTVVIPAILGIAVGRFLDTRLGSGIFWTLSFLMVGLAIGCLAAWRHVDEVMKS
jgi:ATP synthase protein I